ncbi:DUF177 domain-containing protein [Collinsella sp. BA40]|uniref:YceD family protein n=1 Tax=Collinsella sp. BA40 TaxID=2560852 RepID=UPI0011C739A5|nr:DUF177 domain-containing protein [Collinsella sp. BA40]TXF36756.1 DUF177 domain-containing protein [Collinsella sp. BA40]
MDELIPVVVDLTGQLENPGESLPVNGRVEVSSFTVGDKDFALADGISYDVVLTNAGDGILVTGMVRATATGACDRCLDEAHVEIAGEIEEYYLFEAPEDQEEFEDGFELIGEDRLIDLAGAINDAVVMDVPYVVLCQPDCAGLCPVCGVNLNREQCDCAAGAEERWVESDENPFAALKNLKFDD